jgi:hypothetical protein
MQLRPAAQGQGRDKKINPKGETRPMVWGEKGWNTGKAILVGEIQISKKGQSDSHAA